MLSDRPPVDQGLGSVWTWREFRFEVAGKLELQRDASGGIQSVNPAARYVKRGEVKIHQYGAGPFCEFRIRLPKPSGVYAFFENDQLRYVGKAANLDTELRSYGKLSPANCYIRGRETRCRVNNLIFKSCMAGSIMSVFYHKTEDYESLESTMIDELQPPWNIRGRTR